MYKSFKNLPVLFEYTDWKAHPEYTKTKTIVRHVFSFIYHPHIQIHTSTVIDECYSKVSRYDGRLVVPTSDEILLLSGKITSIRHHPDVSIYGVDLVEIKDGKTI